MSTHPDTRWSLVVRARGDSPDARKALSELCEIYYNPVHRFVSRWSLKEEADDLTQTFFARLLADDSLARADPELGRFRNYLFAAAKHFLSEAKAKEGRQKRGGDVETLTLDGLTVDDPKALPPDVEFDRAWACALLEHSLSKLRHEMTQKGKANAFEKLRPWLAGTANHGEQILVASELGVSETAVRVLIHRMRRRLRELVETETAQTLEPGDDVVAELRRLLGAW